MSRPSFSLLETLLAAAILALVVAVCLPLLTGSPGQTPLRPDPDLGRYARTDAEVSPPNLSVERSVSTVGGNIEGSWVVVRSADRIALAWIPTHPTPRESAP